MNNIAPIVNEIHADFDTVSAIETMAKSSMRRQDELKEEKKKLKLQLEGILDSDEEYHRMVEQKELNAQALKSIKERIMSDNPKALELAQKLKDTTSEAREVELALEDYLREYKEKSHQLTINDYLGALRTIEVKHKLASK